MCTCAASVVFFCVATSADFDDIGSGSGRNTCTSMVTTVFVGAVVLVRPIYQRYNEGRRTSTSGIGIVGCVTMLVPGGTSNVSSTSMNGKSSSTTFMTACYCDYTSKYHLQFKR